MNTRPIFNKYGNYSNDTIYNKLLIEEKEMKGDKYLQFDGLEKFVCGNVDKKIILEDKKNDTNNLRIKVLDKPFTAQLYFDTYYKNPITPIQQFNNGLEKWQLNQPLSFNTNINGEYPIDKLKDDKLISKYDNPDMYRRIFFNQNDARI
jgi:hypothetical protein